MILELILGRGNTVYIDGKQLEGGFYESDDDKGIRFYAEYDSDRRGINHGHICVTGVEFDVAINSGKRPRTVTLITEDDKAVLQVVKTASCGSNSPERIITLSNGEKWSIDLEYYIMAVGSCLGKLEAEHKIKELEAQLEHHKKERGDLAERYNKLVAATAFVDTL
jgi:hypothetical protein